MSRKNNLLLLTWVQGTLKVYCAMEVTFGHQITPEARNHINFRVEVRLQNGYIGIFSAERNLRLKGQNDKELLYK